MSHDITRWRNCVLLGQFPGDLVSPLAHEAMFKQGIPPAAFEVDDIEGEAKRLKKHGVKFTRAGLRR